MAELSQELKNKKGSNLINHLKDLRNQYLKLATGESKREVFYH